MLVLPSSGINENLFWANTWRTEVLTLDPAMQVYSSPSCATLSVNNQSFLWFKEIKMDEMSYCSFSGGEEYKNHFQPGE